MQEFARDRNQPQPSPAASAALSPRQVEVLTLVSNGLTYKEVASRLGLTERTVKYHMSEIMGQLHLANRAEVLDYARGTGLLRS